LESVYTARYPGFESLSLRHEVGEGRWFGVGEAREYIRKDQEELLDRLLEAIG
jgi:predicted NUDIX family NTP pyrophosphohydrolase